jgi:hypothetical protein
MRRRLLALLALLAAAPAGADIVGAHGLGLALWPTRETIEPGAPIELTAELRNEGHAALNVVTGTLPSLDASAAHFAVEIVDSAGRTIRLASAPTLSYRPLAADDVTTLQPGEKRAFTFAIADAADPEHRRRLATGEPEPADRRNVFYAPLGAGAKPAFWRITVRYVATETGASLGTPLWQGTITSNPARGEVAGAPPPGASVPHVVEHQWRFDNPERY